jgi:hypothetical protein
MPDAARMPYHQTTAARIFATPELAEKAFHFNKDIKHGGCADIIGWRSVSRSFKVCSASSHDQRLRRSNK